MPPAVAPYTTEALARMASNISAQRYNPPAASLPPRGTIPGSSLRFSRRRAHKSYRGSGRERIGGIHDHGILRRDPGNDFNLVAEIASYRDWHQLRLAVAHHGYAQAFGAK